MDSQLAMLAPTASASGPWQAWEGQAEQLRCRVAALLGAQQEQIALIADASTAAYQVASSMAWTSRPRIVTSVAEFPGVGQAWLSQRRRGAEVAVVGDRAGRVQLADYLRAINSGTALVSVPVVTYRDSHRMPVGAVIEAAHRVGAEVFIDGYQALGVEPLDMRQLGCDYLVSGFGKYALGLPGVVALYERDPRSDRVPALTGWHGRRDPHRSGVRRLDWADDARRFQAGTPAVSAVYAANAGLSVLSGWHLGQVRQHVVEVIQYAHDRASSLGLATTTPRHPAEHGGHLAVAHPVPQRLAAWMAEHGVAVAPRGSVVRLAAHAFTSTAEIDAAFRLISEFSAALPASERRRAVRA
ncbi:aminotransferase class V-fold PLP-dependent enzyme [Micromonospora chokoriensis]